MRKHNIPREAPLDWVFRPKQSGWMSCLNSTTRGILWNAPRRFKKAEIWLNIPLLNLLFRAMWVMWMAIWEHQRCFSLWCPGECRATRTVCLNGVMLWLFDAYLVQAMVWCLAIVLFVVLAACQQVKQLQVRAFADSRCTCTAHARFFWSIWRFKNWWLFWDERG